MQSLGFWLFILSSPASSAMSDNAPMLTRDDILAIVESNRSGIRNLSVTSTFNAVIAPVGAVDFVNETTITVAGDRTYIDRVLGPDPTTSPDAKTRHRRTAFNGTRYAAYDITDGYAIISTEPHWEMETRGCGFFDMMLLNRQRPEMPGGMDQNLISILKSPASSLRNALDDIDARPCYVVDVFRDPLCLTERNFTAWLDPERGFLPVRQVFYQGSGQPLIEFTIDDAEEVKGIWFAISGSKRVYSDDGHIEGEYRLSVARVDNSRPAIMLNQELPQDYFDIWKHLPPGTRVLDSDVKEGWTVGGRDYEALSQSVAEIVRKSPAAQSERQVRNSPQPTRPTSLPSPHNSSTHPIAVVVTAAIAFGVLALLIAALVIVWLRNHRSGGS